MTSILWKDGVSGLYRGYGVAFLNSFTFRGIYFGAFDTIRPLMPRESSVLSIWLMAQVTTNVASIISYPFNTVSR